MKTNHLGRAGQSSLEFALTLILLTSIVFFFIQLSIVLAYGNFVQYATFMSARAYLSAGQSLEDQKSRAKDVMVRMLRKSPDQPGAERFPSIARGVGGVGATGVAGMEVDPPSQFKDGDRDSSWMQGVRYTFRSRLFMIPLGSGSGSRNASTVNSVTLTSESWLGRDPAFEECQNDMDKKYGKGIFDNGC